MTKASRTSKLLPYHIITEATAGNVEAINIVLKHFEGYIAVLATKQLYDEHGVPHYCVDETLRRRLKTKLIMKILEFEIA